MQYPDNLESKVNFDKIKEWIREECTSALGTAMVEKVGFSNDINLLNKLLDQTEEFRQILVSGELFPSSNYLNIYPYLEKAKIEGTFLYEDDFHEIKLSLITLKDCVDFFRRNETEYPWKGSNWRFDDLAGRRRILEALGPSGL